MWGEVDQASASFKQPQIPIWHNQWRPSGVSCQVPLVQSSQQLSSSAAASTDNQPLLLNSLDFPKDSHDSNLLLHSIDLQQYVEEMRQTIASSDIDSNGHLHDTESVMVPAPPTTYWNTKGRKTWEKPIACNPENKLTSYPVTSLDSKNCNLLQKKSVAAIGLLVGYEAASEQSLDVLSSLLGDFLERFSTLLKRNFEDVKKKVHGSNQDISMDFVVESTLHQFGMGGKRELTNYWKKLGSRHQRLMEEASQQVEDWKKLLGGHGALKDREILMKSMSLRLEGTGHRRSVDARLPSPWVASTPGLLGEEELLLSSDLNMDSVAQVKPVVDGGSGGGSSSDFSSTHDSESTLSLDFVPPISAAASRKRSRSTSFNHEN